MTGMPSFADLLASMLRDSVDDRLSGTVRVRDVQAVDTDQLLPQDDWFVQDSYGPMLVREYGYRVLRRDDLARCESLDGHVHFIAGRYTVWLPQPNTGRIEVIPRTQAWFRPPDDQRFGVARPRPDRWQGEDFTRPIGVPEPVTFLGRAAWQVELAPPPHKPYELSMVVDDRTGLVLREANAGFGSFAEWTDLDTAAELPADLFVWDDERDRPVPPSVPVERPPAPGHEDEVAARLAFLDALVGAIDRRAEVVTLVAAADDTQDAVERVARLLVVSHEAARAVVNLPLDRFTARGRERIVTERDALRRELNPGR